MCILLFIAEYVKLSGFVSIFGIDRLSEYAPTYFDLSSFPEGEMKRALERARKKTLFDGAVPKKKKAQLEKSRDGSDDRGNSTKSNKKAKLEA